MDQFLICEDDVDMQDFLNAFLHTMGYEYQIVEKGEEVLPILQDKSMKLLLLDLNLPDMDGKEVVRLVRNDPACKDIPIYIFSASISISQAARDLPVNGFISKPFELDELERVINNNLGKAAG